MSEQQDRHCMTPEERPLVQCVIPANKLPLQELNHLIEIKLLFSGYLKIFSSSTKYLRRSNAVFPPEGAHGYRLTWASFSHSIKMRVLPVSAANHCLGALPATMSAFKSRAATSFSAKIARFTKKFTRSEKTSLDLKFLRRS